MSNEKLIIKQGLTGGTSSDLDSISYASMVTGNIALVVDGQLSYRLEYDATSSEAENSPYVIAPDDVGANPGRWLLKDNFSIIKENLLLNSEFRYNPFEYAADGIATIANNVYGHAMWINRTGSTQKYIIDSNQDIDLDAIELGQKNDDILNENGNYVTFSIESGAVQIIGCGILSWTTVTPTSPHTWILDSSDNSGFIELKKSGVNKFKRPKLERDKYATRFERIASSSELYRCYQYIWVSGAIGAYDYRFETTSNKANTFTPILFPVEMVAVPTCTLDLANTDSSAATSATASVPTKTGITIVLLNNAPGAGTWRFGLRITADAQYYS